MVQLHPGEVQCRVQSPPFEPPDEDLRDRGQWRLGGWAGPQRGTGLRDLVVVDAAERVLLRAEVVEERARRDVRGGGDLVDGHPLQPAVGDEPDRRVPDRLPGLALLALPQPKLSRGGHLDGDGEIVAGRHAGASSRLVPSALAVLDACATTLLTI